MILNDDELALKSRVESLINNGSNYCLGALKEIYSKDLLIVMVFPSGEVMKFNYEDNLNFFATKRNAGAEPLDTSAIFNDIEVVGNTGHVIVTRYMTLIGDAQQKIIFNLTLSRKAGTWKVVREFAVVSNDT